MTRWLRQYDTRTRKSILRAYLLLGMCNLHIDRYVDGFIVQNVRPGPTVGREFRVTASVSPALACKPTKHEGECETRGRHDGGRIPECLGR